MNNLILIKYTSLTLMYKLPVREDLGVKKMNYI